jgi:hypothetical protein
MMVIRKNQKYIAELSDVGERSEQMIKLGFQKLWASDAPEWHACQGFITS